MTREFGPKAIVVLHVGGEDRSLWIFETALKEKLASELERRGAAEFEVGERIVVSRGEAKVVSEAGRGYWPITVEFPDRQTGTAAAILGAAVRDDSSAGAAHPRIGSIVPASPTDDDIPFAPSTI